MTGKFIDQTYQFKAAKTEGIQQQWHDLAYMDGARHKLDVYLPNQVKPQAGYPVIVDIYGGGLWRGDKSSFKMNPALQLLAAGYAVVSPDYSLLWQAAFPAQVSEMQAVLYWVKQFGADYGLDGQHLALMGESSGAQLAVLTALQRPGTALFDERWDNNKRAPIRAVIAMYGPYVVDQFPQQFAATKTQPKYAETGSAESFEGQLLGAKRPVNEPELVQKYNPLNYLTPAMPPILGIAGTADQVVPYQQTVELVQAAQALVGEQRAQWHLVSGAQHGVADFMTDEIVQMKLNFLNEFMGGK